HRQNPTPNGRSKPLPYDIIVFTIDLIPHLTAGASPCPTILPFLPLIKFLTIRQEQAPALQ
ncbi:MAG: hypothetical protein IKV98_06930, partial [Clostridia bacterium]|nr:hypothetical protein [Clostridia bacterium]